MIARKENIIFPAVKIYLSGGKGACSSFIERCFAFIGENAVDTVKTTAFCNLPKDALVKLISSDYLGLEEEDVWRAVLNWAKYQVPIFWNYYSVSEQILSLEFEKNYTFWSYVWRARSRTLYRIHYRVLGSLGSWIGI